jgi:hypothetical protein
MKIIGMLSLGLLQIMLMATDLGHWPFPDAGGARTRLFETAAHIGIYNRHCGVVFKKQDFSPAGFYRAGGRNAILSGTDLWILEMFFLEPDQGNSHVRYIPFTAGQCRRVEVNSEQLNSGIVLKAAFSNAVYQRMGIDAEATVTLGDDDELPRWRINAGVANKKLTSIWKVEFPRLNFRNPAAKAAECGTRRLRMPGALQYNQEQIERKSHELPEKKKSDGCLARQDFAEGEQLFDFSQLHID